MRAAALLLALVAAPVFADGAIVTTTAKPTEWILKKPGTPDVVLARYATPEACEKAISTAGDYVCDKRIAIKAVGSCSPTAPEFELKLDADGFLVLPRVVVDELPDGSWGPTKEEGYLPTPQPYPACWVKGLVPYTGKWQAPEGAPVHEPVCRPDSTVPECVKP